MQPYVNPNYFAQYPQYQNFGQPMQQAPNPYLDRLAQLQQMQSANAATQNFSPLGKIVENVDVLKTTEVPMDGNAYYFPKADGSEIYSKQWLQNGTTRILTFKPVLEEDPTNLPEAIEKSKFELFTQVLDGIQSDIRTLTEKVDKISKPARAKKESAEDE